VPMTQSLIAGLPLGPRQSRVDPLNPSLNVNPINKAWKSGWPDRALATEHELTPKSSHDNP
jgi:hypothetical protein